MAYSAKKDNRRHKVFVICGDGECNEGTVWEAALVAHHFRLNNLIAIIDHNKMQSLGFCEDTIALAPFAAKWTAFGWNVIEVDGHAHSALRGAFLSATQAMDRPTVIVADTVKGKGVSFMENDVLWHYRFPHEGLEYDSAVAELRSQMPKGVADPYVMGPTTSEPGDGVQNQ
jgi:transketolase